MTVGVMAVVAQHEREAISARTKAALAAAKARGTKLGGLREGAPSIGDYQAQGSAAAAAKADSRAQELREVFDSLEAEGLSLNAIALRLNDQSVLTSRGIPGAWTATTVKRVRDRIRSIA